MTARRGKGVWKVLDFSLGFSGSFSGRQGKVGCVVWGKLVLGRVNRVKKDTES